MRRRVLRHGTQLVVDQSLRSYNRAKAIRTLGTAAQAGAVRNSGRTGRMVLLWDRAE